MTAIKLADGKPVPVRSGSATPAQLRKVGLAAYNLGMAEYDVVDAINKAGGAQDVVRDAYIQARMVLSLVKKDRITPHEYSAGTVRVAVQLHVDRDADAILAYDAGKKHWSETLAKNGIASTETRGAGGKNRAPAGNVAPKQTEAQRKAAKRAADAVAKVAAEKLAAGQAAAAAATTPDPKPAKTGSTEDPVAAIHLNPLRNAGFLPPRKADKPTIVDSHRYIDQASRHLLDWTLGTGKDITGAAWEDAVKLFHRTIQNLAAKR